MCKWIAKPKDFLVIYGSPGTGKTYLCSAITEHVINRVESFRAFNERDLFRRIRSGISNSNVSGDYLEALQYLINDDFLIIDDFGAQMHNEWREEILMELVDYRYNFEDKATMFTTNLSPKEVKEKYGERIYSRLFASENTVILMENLPDLRMAGL